jgi:hypothetical protein
MSYCRFENTLADLKDCQEKLDGMHSINTATLEAELSATELRAARELISTCVAIAESYGDIF